VILEEIEVGKWRGYRETHVFRFQAGINLLVGRNEAGKSTLFEVLTRALFDRHNSKTEEVRAMQPIGTSLGPEVTIQFSVAGTRHKVVKRFLQNAKSEFYSERQGKWEMEHEGDQADAHLREVLRGEATTRTAARPEHRGLAQALWYLQSDGAIPEKMWNEGVRQGLQGLVQSVATSPRERAILERVEKAYQEYWTETGRIKTNSPLGLLQAEIPEIEKNLATLQGKAKTVEGYRTDLEAFHAEEVQKAVDIKKAKDDLTESSARVQAAEAHERERGLKESAKTEAAQKVHLHQKDLTQIDEKQKKVQERRTEIKNLEDALSETATDARQEATASEHHARHWKKVLEPVLKGLEAELGAFHSLERLRKMEKDRARLEKHLEKIAGINAQIQARKTERDALVAPDDKEWKRFGIASNHLIVLQAKVDASAIRVAFEWSGKERKVETQPSLRTSEDAEYIVTEPTEFQIEGVGKVRVRSGASSLEDLLTQRDATEQDVRQVLTRFGVADADAVATLHERGRELDRTLATLKKSLDEANGTEPGAEEELARTKRGIEEETRGISTLPPDVLQQGGQWIRDQIAAKELQKENQTRAIAEEQKAEKMASHKHLELVEARQGTSNKLAERKAEIHTHEEGITEILQTYGTIDQLKKCLAASEEAARMATAAHDALLSGYEEKVVIPKRLHEQAHGRVRELEKQIGDSRIKIATTRARIDAATEQGNYSQRADLEIEVERKKRRLEVLQRRADGTKLLHDLVAAHEKQRSSELSGPVQSLANRWLAILTDDNYDTLRIDEALRPAGVHVARYRADLPLASLSHGTQEQVVVLLRLAIGVLVSGEERNLVVIDDRLVNADPLRMKRLCLILQEAAETCQIVIATCNDTPYAGLSAQIVRVPADGNKVEVRA